MVLLDIDALPGAAEQKIAGIALKPGGHPRQVSHQPPQFRHQQGEVIEPAER